MKPLVSVIIPTFNEEKNIGKCLYHLSNQTVSRKKYEIILVDKESTDNTINIAKGNVDKIIKVDKNVSFARNRGVEQSRGKIILFTDADILVPKNTIEKILDRFDKNEKISAIIGTFSENCPHKNFFSEYQNINMIYFYEKLPIIGSLFFTSIAAIRKNVFKKIGGFNTNMDSHEDLELGKRLFMNGFKTYLDRTLKVKHSKFYSFSTFVRTRIRRGSSGLILFLSKKYEKTFDVVPLNFKIDSLFLLTVIFSTVFLYRYPLLITPFLFGSVVIFLLVNFDYLSFLKRKKGVWFMLKSVPMLFFVLFLTCIGSLIGLYKYLKGERY
jgi:glycosyltransferase involved in cell wall biosynthesis